METSPYHVIMVTKERAYGENIEYILVSNGEVIASTSKYIP
jgi:hypothetical protein